MYTKAQTLLVRFVVNLLVKHVENKSNQWSLSLIVHIYAKSRQLLVCVAKCCQYKQMLSPREYTWVTRHLALSLCALSYGQMGVR